MLLLLLLPTSDERGGETTSRGGADSKRAPLAEERQRCASPLGSAHARRQNQEVERCARPMPAYNAARYAAVAAESPITLLHQRALKLVRAARAAGQAGRRQAAPGQPVAGNASSRGATTLPHWQRRRRQSAAGAHPGPRPAEHARRGEIPAAGDGTCASPRIGYILKLNLQANLLCLQAPLERHYISLPPESPNSQPAELNSPPTGRCGHELAGGRARLPPGAPRARVARRPAHRMALAGRAPASRAPSGAGAHHCAPAIADHRWRGCART